MIHLGEVALESFLYLFQILHGYFCVQKLSFTHLARNNLFHESIEGSRGIILEAAGSGFDTVAKHQDNLFAGARPRARISEGVSLGRVSPVIEELGVEVAGAGCSVVSKYEVSNDPWQVVLFGHFSSVGYVLHYFLGALQGRELRMVAGRCVSGNCGFVLHEA